MLENLSINDLFVEIDYAMALSLDSGVSVPCTGSSACPRGNAIFNHSAEDPSIFRTKRGWHMLVNALPGGCHPQESQGGGHAWSIEMVYIVIYV
eukprot:SAG31_NODE_360_length_17025_cov_5.362460_4_plen_94_part_00